MVGDMLDHLVGDNNIEAASLERQVKTISNQERNIAASMAFARDADRFRANVHSGNHSAESAE